MARSKSPSKKTRNSPKSSPAIASLPKSSPASSPPVITQSPGIIGQILTNGAGVALGHVVAHHIIGGDKDKAGSGSVKSCAKEIEAFLACASQNTYDSMSMCSTVIENLRTCHNSTS
jgi:hypothetical protein